MRRGDQVIPLHLEVAHARAGQVELQGLPRGAIVQRDPDAVLRPRVEQSAPHRILSHHARVRRARDAARDGRPGATVVGTLPQVGCEVVLLISIRRDIDHGGIVRRGIDVRRPRELAISRGCHVHPGRAGIAREMDPSVIRARPEHACHTRRLGERIDRPIPLRARHLAVDRAAGASERGRVRDREVTADALPTRPFVPRAPDVL